MSKWMTGLLLSVIALVAAASEYVASPEWLLERLNDPSVKIIEVSNASGVYEQGHIPGALLVRWNEDLAPIVASSPSRSRFEELMSRLGLRPTDTLVLYSDQNNFWATRFAWILEIFGHRSYKVLDGGRARWIAERRPLTTQVPRPRPTTYRAGPTREGFRAYLSDVLEVVQGHSQAVLLDSRSPDEFTGRIAKPATSPEEGIVAGHIPGAINVHWNQAVNADGSFKSAEELSRLFEAAGLRGDRPVIVYCLSGARSSHTWFVLNRILGWDARLYDGSWKEYCQTPGVSIANPSATGR